MLKTGSVREQKGIACYWPAIPLCCLELCKNNGPLFYCIKFKSKVVNGIIIADTPDDLL